MPSPEHLREQIAIEAARLMLRGKEQDFASARKRAARWLKRTKLHREDLPSNAEIQAQISVQAGLFAAERDGSTLLQMRRFAADILEWLHAFRPSLIGSAVSGPVTRGAGIEIELQAGSLSEVLYQLREHRVGELSAEATADGADARTSPVSWSLAFVHGFPCVVRRMRDTLSDGVDGTLRWTLNQLEKSLQVEEPSHEDDPDVEAEALAMLKLLMEPLARIRLDPFEHPEGDALYHSLQVFELGREERPYDEEFLLACLLHDVGLTINRRHPVLSALDALGGLVTERTRFLIEARPVAAEYLRTGIAPKSLRKSDDFEDAVLLARCDRAGRVRGAQVSTLDEAFEYVTNLREQWADDSNGSPFAT